MDLIHVSADSYQFGFFNTHLPMFAPHGANVYLAAEIKKHVSKPVATIGALNDPAQMEEILADRKADVIYMARELLADPFLPNKVFSGQEDRIVKCLRCFVCMAKRPTTQTRRCAVNPLIGREIDGMEVTPVLRPKRVLIAGAGVAGLKAPDSCEVLIPGETVICAVGQRANRADAEALRMAAPFVRKVGDCIRPANITRAVYEGYHAALDV